MTERLRWTLRVSFDDLKTQEQQDPELAFPRDEVSLFVSYLIKSWGIPPEEVDEYITWEPTKVTVQSYELDSFYEVLGWLTINTIPLYMHVKRNEER
jgi:hypothetical protein